MSDNQAISGIKSVNGSSSGSDNIGRSYVSVKTDFRAILTQQIQDALLNRKNKAQNGHAAFSG